MENLLEDLAELEHKQWAHWTKYMLDRLEQLESEQDPHDPYKVLHQKENWRRQIAVPYPALTESEKDSDRSWASKSLKITAEQIDSILEELESRTQFFYTGVMGMPYKYYERGFADAIHNARAKIKEALEKSD